MKTLYRRTIVVLVLLVVALAQQDARLIDAQGIATPGRWAVTVSPPTMIIGLPERPPATPAPDQVAIATVAFPPAITPVTGYPAPIDPEIPMGYPAPSEPVDPFGYPCPTEPGDQVDAPMLAEEEPPLFQQLRSVRRIYTWLSWVIQPARR